MNIIKILTLLICIVNVSFAQTEICNNGIDDDGDGFIDCFDKKCAGNSACTGFYFGNNVDCQNKPSQFPQFTLKLAWQSANRTADNQSTPSVGDLDGDGIPEIVVVQSTDRVVSILDGRTGSVKKSLKVSYTPSRQVVLGRVTKNSCPWIFIGGMSTTTISAYDCNLNLQWTSATLYDSHLSVTDFGITDFDSDGLAEIYFANYILDALTGTTLVNLPFSYNNTAPDNPWISTPVAVDILGDPKLELVEGGYIYSVDLGPRTANSGTLNLVARLADYTAVSGSGSINTSIADYNQDGYADILTYGSDIQYSGANTTLFFWDVHNNTFKKFIDTSIYANGYGGGVGVINVADIDGDGKLNVTYVSGSFLYALDENWKLKWRIPINEQTSGITGCTVFDFNGDGAAETVYRDEQYLYIINGKDGSINTQQRCISRTNVEYPVVADVDGDGATEICVACGFDDNLSWQYFQTPAYPTYFSNSCIRVYKSATEPWVPSRKLWNQFQYFNVNVNDDLTIPATMQKPWLTWSTNVCSKGPYQPLNSFLNQSSYRDSNGCPTYAVADLVNVPSLLQIQQPVCPSTNFTISMGVQNIGDMNMIGNVPVTFYKGDPTKAGALKLNTVTVPINLNKGQTQTFTNLQVTGTGGSFTLYVSLNDAGTTVPTPITLPNTPFSECNYNNLISAAIAPAPVHVTAVKLTDNVKCVGSTSPNNGSATAYVLVNGVQNVTDYSFSWLKNKTDLVAAYTGATFSGLAEGIYYVVSKNISTGCTSDTASVVIKRVDPSGLSVSILVDSPSNSCTTPNGQVEAVVAGGAPVGNYNFAWFEGNDIFTSPQVSISNIASNLAGGKTYTVLVTQISSGCQTVGSVALPNATNSLVVSASAVDALCTPPGSGRASASVNGATSGFTFAWYNGSAVKPLADFTGSNYNLIPAGSYTVTATDNSSLCTSPPVTVQVNVPSPFTVKATLVNNQTSCNPLAPNGAATATVAGATTGYLFTWFKGQSTSSANAVFGSSGLASGTYTVLATSLTTGCTATDFVTVNQNVNNPSAALLATPNVTCNATTTNASTGTVSASITFNGAAVTDFTNYQFVWHQGSGANDPVIAGATSSTLTQLSGGNYTLVATRSDLGCTAPPVTATVTNTSSSVTLTLAQTPSTNCDPALANGIAEVTQVNGVNVGNTSAYSYQWYSGSDITVPIAGATSPRLTGLQGGSLSNFTVLVTDLTTGCQTQSTTMVADAKILPTLVLSEVDNTICNPLLTTPATSYNGQVNVTSVSHNGVSYSLTSKITYNFFTNATGSGPFVQSSHARSLLNQSAGQFSATATIDSLGCTSDPGAITISNNLSLPAIVTSADASSNCTAGLQNGAAHVKQIDGIAPASSTNYLYQWFDGSTADPSTIKAGQTAPDLGSTTPGGGIQGTPAGLPFTVQVTRKSDGCQNNASAAIMNSPGIPLIFISLVKNNNVCDTISFTPDGALKAIIAVAGVIQPSPLSSNWVVSWSNGKKGEIGGAFSAGTHSAFVIDTNTGCSSSVGTGTVVDQPDIPVLQTNSAHDQTSCDLTKPNGQLTGSATNGPAGSTLTYTWYAGIGTGGSSIVSINGQASGSSNSTAANLSTGSYTFSARNEKTGCQSSQSVFLPQQVTYPTFTGTVTDMTSCVPTNGELDITLTSITNPTLFTIYYLNEVNLAHTSDPSVIKSTATKTFQNDPTKLNYSGLITGTYTVLVRDETSQCEASPQTFTVNDKTNKVVKTTAVASATFCTKGAVGGKLNITVTPGGAYSYAWYSGAPTNSNYSFYNNINPPTFAGGVIQTTQNLDGSNNANHSGVGAGTYSVVITDPVGCGTVYSDVVPYVGSPTVDLTLTNSSKCDPSLSDASVLVKVTGTAGVQYSVELFQGNNSAASGTQVAGGDDGCTLPTRRCGKKNVTTTFNKTDAAFTGTAKPLLGDYLVRIVENSGCAIEKLLTLGIDPKIPIVTVDAIGGNTSCAGGTPDGSVKLTVNNDPQDSSNLALKNYQIKSISPAPVGFTAPQNITAGASTTIAATFDTKNYDVTIIDITSGCTSDQFVTVPSQSKLPTAFVVTPSNDEYCAPATNGNALATTLTGPSGNFTNYNFEWYADNALSTLVMPITVGDGTNTGGELLTAVKVITYNPANWPLGLTGSGNGGKTFYVRAQKQGGIGDKCYTSVVQVNISDTHVVPRIALTPFDDTSCSGAAEGRIELTASTPSSTSAISGATYTYSWSPDPSGGNATPVSAQNGASTFTISVLPSGTYNITALNETSQCVANNSATIDDSKFDNKIVSNTKTDQVLCAADGSITITGISIDRSVTRETLISVPSTAGDLSADFSYQWFNATSGNSGAFNSATPIQDGSSSTITEVRLAAGTGAQQNSAMGAGTYYVIATRTNTSTLPGKGCSTTPYRVDVGDQRRYPQLSFATTPSTSCDNNFDGKISVSATTGGVGAGANYNFVWTNDPDGPGTSYNASNSSTNNTASPFSTPGSDLIGPGNYAIRVTNFVTQCYSDENVSVVSNPATLDILTASKTDQAICAPDGSISVQTLNKNTSADYTYQWYRETPASSPLMDVFLTPITGKNLFTGNGPGQYPVMGADTYFITATKNAGTSPGSGCITPPFEVIIKDTHVNPVVPGATSSPNLNCAGGSGNATISINEPSPNNFIYLWFTGDDINGTPVTTTSGINDEGIQSLQDGDYTVQVQSKATSCISVKTFAVGINSTIVNFDPSGFSTSPITTCNLLTGAPVTGSATVSSMLENNVSSPFTNYTFQWTDAANTILQSGAAPTINNLSPGNYFVHAINTSSSCTADLSFNISDNTGGSTTVALVDFAQPERCVNPKTGFLSVQGGGTVAGPYTYEWYAGDQRPTAAGSPLVTGSLTPLIAPGPPAPSNGSLNNIQASTGQMYTVKVINSNNCWAVDAYPIPVIMNPVALSASTNPLTFCNSFNGEVFATVASGSAFNYNFFWAAGNSVTPPGDFATSDVTGLPSGEYTAIAIDKLDAGCASQPVKVTVEKKQVFPSVTAQVLQGLTFCDPLRPNGVASANVGGDVSHYTFDWFIGNSSAGTSFYRGAIVGDLAATSYTVVGSDLVTGCSGTASITVPTDFAKIPDPVITVISEVTSCVTDNGELSVSVDGVTKDYIFDWADGASAPPPIDFTGEFYKNLATGEYTVMATSRITGCQSDPVSASINKNQKIPDFDFITMASLCTNDPKNPFANSHAIQGTGFVTITVSNEVSIANVTWDNADGSYNSQGANLINAYPGQYTATVKTTLGCESSKTVEVPVEIFPYNGVSRRNGSENSYFLINCIDGFPNNHVEIYNRAGTKVYEADRYDNSDVLFDGRSNKGISLMGTNLPAGTYFYIISKGDGSKNLIGYLELVD